MKKIIRLLLVVVVFLSLPAHAAETDVLDYHEASIPVEFVKKKGNETESEHRQSTSNLAETKTPSRYTRLPRTGAILQIGVSFVGTFLVVGTLLLIKRRYKNE